MSVPIAGAATSGHCSGGTATSLVFVAGTLREGEGGGRTTAVTEPLTRSEDAGRTGRMALLTATTHGALAAAWSDDLRHRTVALLLNALRTR
ncbi:hypothetical protein Misp01_81140 [Microtetraspora sp. NBRC 13810]|nr:hypothetical protein Misp01_81140 [Microtetraspora sp. NBRC 13810]